MTEAKPLLCCQNGNLASWVRFIEHEFDIDLIRGQVSSTGNGVFGREALAAASGCKDKSSQPAPEVPPNDVRAFFGHPLTAATSALNGEDTNASAMALLHEYNNLPAMDRSGMKIGDKFHSLQDIFRDEERREGDDGTVPSVPTTAAEYVVAMLTNDIDDYFNQTPHQHALSPDAHQQDATLPKTSSADFAVVTGDITTSTHSPGCLDLSLQQSALGNISRVDYKTKTNSIVSSQKSHFNDDDLTDVIATNGHGLTGIDENGQRPEESTAKLIKVLKDKLLQKRSVSMPSGHTDSLSNIVQDSLDITNDMKSSQHYSVDMDTSQLNIRSFGVGDDQNGVYTPMSASQQFSHLTNVKLEPAPLSVNVGRVQYCHQQAPSVHSAPVRQEVYPPEVYYSTSYMYANGHNGGLQRVDDPSGNVLVDGYMRQHSIIPTDSQYQYCFGVSPDAYNHDTSLKSPDSGFQEPCVSPSEAAKLSTLIFAENEISTNQERPAKRRRSGNNSACVKHHCVGDKHSSSTSVPKLELDASGYKYFIESPISTTQKIDEDRITYLNKGQYYGMAVEYTNNDRIPKCQHVTSLVTVVFREEKSSDEELKTWEFWHSRQHNAKQRIIDIDTKNSSGICPNSLNEIGHNAVMFKWNPLEAPAKLSFALNCLSTDFSNQKGVKGLPLHIKIDTYESAKPSMPVSRGYCQIKVFCDKGAERKARDEERRRNVRAKTIQSGRKRHEDIYQSANERSEFYAMVDLLTPPVLFNPTLENTTTKKKKVPTATLR